MILPLLLTVDFMNFTYTKLPCSANVPPPAIVRKGSYSYYDKQMGSVLYVIVPRQRCPEALRFRSISCRREESPAAAAVA